MKFLAILVALALEQWYSSNWRGGAERLYTGYLRWLEEKMIDLGSWPATAVALLPVLLVIVVDIVMAQVWALMLVWSVFALYLLMGFRRFSHAVTEITESLQNGDLPTARKAFYDWQGGNSLTLLSSDEIAQRTIEAGALAAYRCVFGIVFWFLIFGPSGAAFYWMLTLVAREWSENPAGEDITVLATARAELGKAARWLLFILDWLPVRFLAFSFAIVGDFEDAIYQWRARPKDDAAFDNNANENLLLATAFGALGLTWTRRPSASAPTGSVPASAEAASAETVAEVIGDMPTMASAEAVTEAVAEAVAEVAGETLAETPGNEETANEKTLGPPPESVPVTPGALPSAIGLVWRALLFWLGLVALVTVAYWSSHSL
ncbi:MAG: regulatory signaling modulator protein AmpE [Proteobacteria bacterium]|nr:regulatory signaling modulator protein AmpE [Pseudomonadota bacterium]MCL2307472.1 regulatory signaling modulator protein AmpE [Pseudomonadota bacterium]